MDIWAKRVGCQYQTLKEHTNWTIEAALRQIDSGVVGKISDILQWEKDKVVDLIFFCAYFHDIGKATKEFQNTISSGLRSYHSMYSASVVDNIEDFLFIDSNHYVNLLFVTVLTHHTLIPYTANSKSFAFTDSTKSFFDDYKNVYAAYMHKECPYNFEFKNSSNIKLKIDDVCDDLVYIHQTDKLRLVYSYVSGILNVADWLASARFTESIIKTSFDIVPSKETLVSRLNFKELKIFQKSLSECDTSVLVEIPTGEGKTEGSLLWAINNLCNSNTKIIYTLPTQVTSNNLYERICKLFDKNECGLVHSAAEVYLEKEYEQENGYIDEYFKSDFLISKNFNKPVTVATIDSLLKYFINIGRFNITIKNFLNSVIIIDEVHSYDLKLMGFLKRFLEICQENGIKVCLMSASIPDKIKQQLKIQTYPKIYQQDLFDKKANEIIKKDFEMDDDFDLIVKKFRTNKNILIVRNNIKDALNIYVKLSEKIGSDNILLHHSAFKKKDKIIKENLIFEKLGESERCSKNFILVATQIVEISLDIDFDIMFTDNAPIDSLVQRFGRVNRKKSYKNKGEIFIYKYNNVHPYKTPYLLDLTFQNIQSGYFSFKEYIGWLNCVYDELFEKKTFINEISRLFDNGYGKHDNTVRSLCGIKRSKDNYDVRDIEVVKENFLLHDDIMDDNIDAKDYYEHTISLPCYYAKNYLYNSERELKYRVLNLKYSFESGVAIPDSKNTYDIY